MSDLTDQVLKEISKEFGDDIIMDGQTVLENEPEVISVSPSLDIGLGGGIPLGSFVVCAGWEKVGKTTTSLWFAKKCQEAGMQVFYLSIEHRLKTKNIKGIKGLKIAKPDFVVIQSGKPDKKEGKAANILTAQKFLKLAEKILKTVPRCLVIFDSFSQLLEEKELTDGMDAQTRGGGAKLLAAFCRQIAPVLAVNQGVIFGIVQLMANTGNTSQFSPVLEKGGNAIKYAHDVKIKAKSDKAWIIGDKQVGQIVTWSIIESALGPPGRQVESYIRYGTGIDEVFELFEFGTQIGLISKSGAWYQFDFVKDEKKPKAQGAEKACQLLVEQPTLVTQLREALDKALGVKR